MKSVLIKILNYVLNKVDTEARRTVQTNEQMAISEMLNVIKELPEKYFKTNRKIRIDCNVHTIHFCYVNHTFTFLPTM